MAAWLLKQNIELGMKGVDIFHMIKHLRRYRVGFVNSVVSFYFYKDIRYHQSDLF